MALAAKTFANLVTFTRASTATYWDSAGVLRTAASGAPRFDYNPVTFVIRGLLVESQSTNLLLQSQDLSAAAYTRLNLVTSGYTDLLAAPDGTVTMDAIIESTTPTVYHGVNQNITKAATANQYAYSLFVKDKGRQIVVAVQNVGATAGVVARFNPAIGTVTGAINTYGTGFTAGAMTVESVGGGIYRLTLTGTSDTAATLSCSLSLHNGTSNTYTGDGSSGVYVWGQQLEIGEYSTSYIPTTTAQVTRATDMANVASISPWYNQAAGTFVVEAMRNSLPAPAASSPGSYGKLATMSDGTNNNAISFGTVASQNNIYTAVTAAGAETMNYAALPMTAGVATKVALAITATSARLAVAGSLAGASDDTSVTMPAATLLTVGHRQDGSQNTAWNGWIRSLKYYPRRVTNAELVSLTT